MREPKDIHATEQLVAAFHTFGEAAAAFYRGALASGDVGLHCAERLTQEAIRSYIATLFRPNGEGNAGETRG